MQKQTESPCIRCGKVRIVAKSWNEYLNNSLVTHTLTVCPDPECQKIVEEQLKKKRENLAAIQEGLSKKGKENIRNRRSINI